MRMTLRPYQLEVVFRTGERETIEFSAYTLDDAVKAVARGYARSKIPVVEISSADGRTFVITSDA